MEQEFPDSARGWVGFNVPFSHRLTAAADILLMPSRFEPCGLNQLYAMQYGTVPVAHATGGLRDTVKTFDPYSPEGTTGWAFVEHTEDSFKGAIWNALETYRCVSPQPRVPRNPRTVLEDPEDSPECSEFLDQYGTTVAAPSSPCCELLTSTCAVECSSLGHSAPESSGYESSHRLRHRSTKQQLFIFVLLYVCQAPVSGDP